VKSGWAGYYDYNYIDQNLIIGNHPRHINFIFANGLSGHGLQHSVAVGRAVMELIVDGDFKTIDLSRFSFQRFLSEDFLEEEIEFTPGPVTEYLHEALDPDAVERLAQILRTAASPESSGTLSSGRTGGARKAFPRSIRPTCAIARSGAAAD